MSALGKPVRLLRRIYGALRRGRASGDPMQVPYQWWREPSDLVGREVCLFVTFDPSGSVSEHAKFHARAWAQHGFSVVLIVAIDDAASFDPGSGLEFASGVLLRGNVGYDFGAWATAIRLLPELTGVARLAMVNDSVYGPLNTFAEMLDQVRSSKSDVVGLVESLEIEPHVQSFVVFFGPAAVQSHAFWQFWQSVQLGTRSQVIFEYELTLAKRLLAGGLTLESLFRAPSGDRSNPTLTRWRSLIDQGFPYIKIQLLRDNPRNVDISDWQPVLAERGYDPRLAERHLGTRAAGAKGVTRP